MVIQIFHFKGPNENGRSNLHWTSKDSVHSLDVCIPDGCDLLTGNVNQYNELTRFIKLSQNFERQTQTAQDPQISCSRRGPSPDLEITAGWPVLFAAC